MVYDEQPGGPVYLSLPLPGVEALANAIWKPPPEEICNEIIEVAQVLLEESADGLIEVDLLHAEVLETYPDVTIGEVAWVLLNSFQVAD